jgi:hypothetical protein
MFIEKTLKSNRRQMLVGLGNSAVKVISCYTKGPT